MLDKAEICLSGAKGRGVCLSNLNTSTTSFFPNQKPP